MSPPKTPRVLVIDHDWLLRMSLADEFRMYGWSVLDVGSGEQALQLAEFSDRRVVHCHLSPRAYKWGGGGHPAGGPSRLAGALCHCVGS